ncbi:MAG: acyl-CoA dehydrogenase family protein [Vicinamibacterales bacterium]
MSPHDAAARASLKGGGWLFDVQAPGETLTPESRTEDQQLISQTVRDFVASSVAPSLDRLDQKDWQCARDLVRQAGALGLLGVDVPEEEGGVHTDTATSMIVSEGLAQPASFAATIGAQVNLTILPLVLFGTSAQKERYLPRLLSGELIGAYGLTEPGAGSDALGGRTSATPSGSGYVLNGEKMWITNGGFADVFIVFAKVDGDKFSAFIVERAFGGVTSGREEHKLGLHGSSTTAVTFRDTPVPAANLLGEVGKGHTIAFNVLNFARLKLGATCAGSARTAIGEASRYAAFRRQFGQSISTFGAIRHKLGEMVVRTYAADSMNYRTAGLIDQQVGSSWSPATLVSALEEFAVEASMAKVTGSEALDFVLDENIQIHGGNGFVRDYPAERYYRDARVNRIFEGTNEINRLLIPGLLAKRAAARRVDLNASSQTRAGTAVSAVLSKQRHAIEGFKRAALGTLQAAVRTFGPTLSSEQEVLIHCADLLMDVYAAESVTLRAAAAAHAPLADLHADVAGIFVHDAALRIASSSRQALSATLSGSDLEDSLKAVTGPLQPSPLNTAAGRRRIADETVRRGSYPF